MKLGFELGVEGRGMTLMPECDVPEYQLPEERSEALHLPHVSENELTRHYTALCKRIHGVNDGFYPLGSCTMKYNPKIDEDMAALPGFTQLHPLQPIETAQGALEALHTLGSELGEVFGMDAVTFQPAAEGRLPGHQHPVRRGRLRRPRRAARRRRPRHRRINADEPEHRRYFRQEHPRDPEDHSRCGRPVLLRRREPQRRHGRRPSR